MQKKYNRKDFLKLTLLTNAAFLTTPLLSFSEKLSIPGKNVDYFKSGDAQYDILRKGFNKRIDKYPAIIALCKNVDGVSEAVLYARKNNLP